MIFFSQYKIKQLQKDISILKGIGKKKEEALKNEGFSNFGSLLYIRPRKYINREKLDNFSTFQKDKYVQFISKVFSVSEVGFGNKKRLNVIVKLDQGLISLIFFRYSKWLKSFFETDEEIFITGKLGNFRGQWQIVHPEFEKIEKNEKILSAGIVSFYKISENLKKVNIDSRTFRTLIYEIFKNLDKNSFYLYDEKFNQSIKLPNLYNSLLELHFPTSRENYFKALYRLKVDELIPLLFLLELKNRAEKRRMPLSLNISNNDIQKATSYLPFQLTDGQSSALNDIISDIKNGICSYRLIQGDVGSGKTAVAFVAMLILSAYGYQSVMMAPTEVLAKQHFMKFKELLFGTNFPVYLVTGDTTKKEKERISLILKSGDTAMVIGTHALIEDYLEFPELGLVIIDEQHRFGVEQRMKLINKGSKNFAPHTIFMTATPIPRTITQTLYGDMDVSTIDTLPSGRLPIKTYILQHDKLNDLYMFLKKEIANGRQAYFIYPLVDESEKMNLKSAIEEFEYLSNEIFPNLKLGLLHGKMKSSEKEEVLLGFKNMKYDILVSTTVVEVGVDVPNSTVMVIENAERFGLSQLHQLRGRVGRGSFQSYCFLVPSKECNEDSLHRLSIMPKTNSGFEISKFDLEIRGPGEFTGVKQSGITEFTFVNLLKDEKLIKELRTKIAKYIDQNSDSKLMGEIKEFLQQEYKDSLLKLNA